MVPKKVGLLVDKMVVELVVKTAVRWVDKMVVKSVALKADLMVASSVARMVQWKVGH